ncbi:MAG: penicillin-binding protein 1C [Bacteroidota bacterium]
MRKFLSTVRKHPWRIALLTLGVSFFVSVFVPLPSERLSPLPVVSLRIVDRNGETLREILSDQEGRAYWLRLDEIPHQVVAATIAAEDKRFFSHPGVDPIAIARALFEDIRKFRWVSGGSTITQQVVKNVYHLPRTLPGKVLEAWYALRLERTVSKQEILLQYLNRISYGNGTFGVEAASRLYFDKPAAHLSIAEAAFLAGLPNSPSINNPYRSFQRAVQRQKYILQRMLEGGWISQDEYVRAVAEPIQLVAARRNFRAPHFTEMVLQLLPPERTFYQIVRTTLDYNVQQAVEDLLKGHVKALRHHRVTNGAVVVIDNQTCDVIALAGSVDYFDSLHSGMVNGALALRQPGSALKPFTYGLALEQGLTAADIIPDIPFTASAEGAAFNPENYDRKYHGPVRLRTALACSYNVPAVRIIDRIGVEALLTRLRVAGFASLDKPASHYGLALTLGDGEVTLLELTRAYSALARGGVFKPHRLVLDVRDVNGKVRSFPQDTASRTVFSPQIAYIITDILRDNAARAPAFGFDSPINLPFPCAVKTGTSKDYKDNWTIGYTPRWTVGVWIGNFDAKPMRTVSGISGAGPLFRDIMLYLEQRGTGGDFLQPPGVIGTKVCPKSGLLPNPNCTATIKEVFIEGTQPKEQCTVHQLVPIDVRTGAVADQSTPEEYVQMQVFEIYPPIFDAWAEGEKIPQPRLRAWEAAQRFSAIKLGTENPPHSSGKENIFSVKPINAIPSQGEVFPKGMEPHRGHVPFMKSLTSEDFAVAFPEDGAVFKIDPVLRRNYQTVKIAVAIGDGYQNVRLEIDGEPSAEISQRRTFHWNLESGEHVFQLVGERNGKLVRSRKVHISVR